MLPAGKAQLTTRFLGDDDASICSAIYVYLRRVDEAEGVDLTPNSDRVPVEPRTKVGKGKSKGKKAKAGGR